MNHLLVLLAIAVAGLSIALAVAISVAVSLHRQVEALRSSKQSLSTRYGQLTEQFLPFIASYPYDSSKFRFIGSPVDGIQFEDDRIVILEFKANKSGLTPAQRHIRNLVKAGKVEFRELRI